MTDETSAGPLRRIIVHPALRETVDAMRKVGVRLPFDAEPGTMVSPTARLLDGIRIAPIEDLAPSKVNPKQGQEIVAKGVSIFAYDESFAKYNALEGIAQFTSHALVTFTSQEYLPVMFLSAYFYTKSKEIGRAHRTLKYSDDPNIESQKDYTFDKMRLIADNVPPGAILIIDGPLIAGDVYTTFLPFVTELHKKDIIPVFIVKNSESSLVLDAVPAWKDRYNSDMHWAHHTLEVGQRSCLFRYQDLHNERNSKVFSYLRAVDNSPIRIEFHVQTFERYKDRINGLFDLIYYLVLVQGNEFNPQPRPVAVAEKYAREALKVLDVHSLMRRAHLVPTMNQVRFGSG